MRLAKEPDEFVKLLQVFLLIAVLFHLTYLPSFTKDFRVLCMCDLSVVQRVSFLFPFWSGLFDLK